MDININVNGQITLRIPALGELIADARASSPGVLVGPAPATTGAPPAAPTTAQTAPPAAPTTPAMPSPEAAPTAAPTYSIDQIAKAGAELAQAGKMPQLMALLQQHGVQAVTQLRPEQYGDFAIALRGLGAQI